MYFPDNGGAAEESSEKLGSVGRERQNIPAIAAGLECEKPLAGFDVIEPDQVVAEFAAAASVSGREHSAIRSQRKRARALVRILDRSTEGS